MVKPAIYPTDPADVKAAQKAKEAGFVELQIPIKTDVAYTVEPAEGARTGCCSPRSRKIGFGIVAILVLIGALVVIAILALPGHGGFLCGNKDGRKGHPYGNDALYPDRDGHPDHDEYRDGERGHDGDRDHDGHRGHDGDRDHDGDRGHDGDHGRGEGDHGHGGGPHHGRPEGSSSEEMHGDEHPQEQPEN